MEAEAMDPAQAFEANLLSRQKVMIEAIECGSSDIQQFYRGATVFITGGSGFLGKQLIEKLFRATHISKCFVLLRCKKGKPIQQRLTEMLQDPVFDMVREQKPAFANNIVAISGDVGELRLGLSDEDWNTITEQVDVILHMAATTRFDEPLRVSTLINVRGTREALILGKACKKLRSYVHVSTAYSNACMNRINTEVLEDFYKSPVEPNAMIKLVETINEERLNDMTVSLIKNWPNTYSFTKAIAEGMVSSMMHDLPICVVRPAIVVCAQREPNPGWVDMSNVYGAGGMLLGLGLGLIHVVYGRDTTCLGLIPVDYVNNAIIAAGWETAKRRDAGKIKTKIYTVTSSTRNPMPWDNLRKVLENDPRKYISPAAIWYGFSYQVHNPILFWLYSWFYHLLPAYFIDAICLILGKQRRLVKIFRKIYRMSIALSYFTLNNWQFVDKNTAKLYDSLSTDDREIFNFDVNKIDWQEYLTMLNIGLRKYIIKDGLKGTKYAQKKQFVFKILTWIVIPLYSYCLFKILYFAIVILSLFVRLFGSFIFYF